MRFGTWNVRNLYRVGEIKSVVGELEKYKLDLVGVQEVSWEGEGYKNLKIKIYKTVILSVELYGCETWSLTLREEHRLREGL
jgi:hypothetical protein